MKGRFTGTVELKMAGNYISNYFKENGIQPYTFKKDTTTITSYLQTFYIKEFFGSRYSLMINPTEKNINSRGVLTTDNVIGWIEGTDKKEEFIVISCHYDHIGARVTEVFNGADDNGSGTVALLEIARAFSLAKQAGQGPRRSLLFVAFSAEEMGLLGSEHFVQNPVVPLSKIVCDLNMDMLGRVDERKHKNPNYVYLIGSDKITKSLHRASEFINASTVKMELDYTYNNEYHPLQLYYRSDHYNFAKNNIPVIFYTDGEHSDYHTSFDTPDKINYELLAMRTKLVFHTAWALAHKEAF
jgi:Zn-dependent M28 family amino/carboxypeptidase